MGIIGSHVNLTSGWRRHQAKPAAEGRDSGKSILPYRAIKGLPRLAKTGRFTFDGEEGISRQKTDAVSKNIPGTLDWLFPPAVGSLRVARYPLGALHVPAAPRGLRLVAYVG
jgi:hypothetical protein